LAAVVEAVLRAWGSVEIDDDFETQLPSPGDCLGDVRRSAVGVGRARVVVCPVADGYCEGRVTGSAGATSEVVADRRLTSDKVEAAVRNLLHIAILYP